LDESGDARASAGATGSPSRRNSKLDAFRDLRDSGESARLDVVVWRRLGRLRDLALKLRQKTHPQTGGDYTDGSAIMEESAMPTTVDWYYHRNG
jgi:hypothetical protein